jgi:RimJ/RimL family protein N-acetyltransferase
VGDLLRVVQEGQRTYGMVAKLLVVEKNACDDERARKTPASRLVRTRHVADAKSSIESEQLAAGSTHAGEDRWSSRRGRGRDTRLAHSRARIVTKPHVPELETARLRLRAWHDDDLEPLARLNADPLVMRHMGRGPMTLDETRRQLDRFRVHWEKHGFGLWAIEDRETSGFLGRTGLSYHAVWPEDPEVGWFLDPEVWGRGLATEAGEASVRYGFETLGVDRLVSICIPENEASRRVMDKLGFSYLTTRRYEEPGLDLWIHARDRDVR